MSIINLLITITYEPGHSPCCPLFTAWRKTSGLIVHWSIRLPTQCVFLGKYRDIEAVEKAPSHRMRIPVCQTVHQEVREPRAYPDLLTYVLEILFHTFRNLHS